MDFFESTFSFIKNLFYVVAISMAALTVLSFFDGFWTFIINHTLYPKMFRQMEVPPPPPPYKEFQIQTLVTEFKKDARFKEKNVVSQIQLHGWEIVRDPDKPFLVYAHGNAQSLKNLLETQTTFFLEELSKKLDRNLILISYPSYGKSQGKAHQNSLTQSVVAAIRRARRYNPHEKVAVLGYSLGAAAGSLASYEMKPVVDKLILIAPFTSLLEIVHEKIGFFYYFAESFIKKNHAFKVLETLKKFPKEILILHGKEDTLVPYQHGKKIYESLPFKDQSVTFTSHKADHGSILEASEQDIIDFLKKK